MREIKIHVWHDGDMSVGLTGDRAEVVLYVPGRTLEPITDPDVLEYIELMKEKAAEMFRSAWDFPVKVMTEDEIKSMPSD